MDELPIHPLDALTAEPPAPDFRRGFLRVPLTFWLEAYCRAPLTRRELQIVSAVLRESWGWSAKDGGVRLWTRPLATRSLARLTGLSTDRLRRDVESLVRRGVFLRRGDRYRLIPDPRAWRPRSYPQPGEGAPPNGRSRPPKPPGDAAETTLPAEAERERKEILKKRWMEEAELSSRPVQDGSIKVGREAAL
jgi:phage replication O-like protein O